MILKTRQGKAGLSPANALSSVYQSVCLWFCVRDLDFIQKKTEGDQDWEKERDEKQISGPIWGTGYGWFREVKGQYVLD